MSDYPNASDKGRVKLLEDLDADGRYERSQVFADGLPFPTSVLPWNGGVLVGAAPDLWFLKDTDGDGRADLPSPRAPITQTGFEAWLAGSWRR
jgi:hypothetical protein